MARSALPRGGRGGAEHILAGDIFQVVLAQRFDLDGASTRSTCTACCAR